MRQKIILILFFLFFTPVLIIGEVFLLEDNFFLADARESVSPIAKVNNQIKPRSESHHVLSAAADNRESTSESFVIGADARPILIRQYLEKYNSPLVEFSDVIFDVSQKYGIDYRLIVAIARQESSLCRKSPPNCYNCWGVGIHSRGTMCFDSYPQAIEFMGNYLREEYLDKGRQTPEEIMAKYCPLSDGSWARGVSAYMAQME